MNNDTKELEKVNEQEQDFLKGINMWCEQNKPLIEVISIGSQIALTCVFGTIITKSAIAGVDKIALNTIKSLGLLR